MANTGNETLAQVDEFLREMFELEVIPQDNRFGCTMQHIKKSHQFTGKSIERKILSMRYTGARMNADLEADAPDSYRIDSDPIVISQSDLRKIGFTLSYTDPAGKLAQGVNSSYNIAQELVTQAVGDLEERRNQGLNQNGNCVKAVIAAVYDEDGTTYSTGTGETDAFLNMDQGSISAFHPGMILDIREGDTDTDVQVTVKVNDVIYSEDHLGVSDIGPGIVVTIDTDYGAGGQDADLDGLDDGDEIVAHGETDGDGFPGSFGTLIDFSSSPSTYFGVDRAAKGNAYLIPMGRDYTSGGNPVVINLDTHFGKMADEYGRLLVRSRKVRDAHPDFALTDAVVCQAQNSLINEIARQAGDSSSRFTKRIASDLDAAARQKLTAINGWTGVVLFHPNLPAIVLQAEELAPANEIRFFEPSAFEMIQLGPKTPTFAMNGSSIWHRIYNSSTGAITASSQAHGYTWETLFCNQPRLLYGIKGVKSSLE